MLVCVVSQRARRLTLIGDVVETAAAADASNWFFPQLAAITEATATASDTVNAFVGQYLLEAASASDAVSAALATVTSRSLIETVVAADAVSAALHTPTTVSAAMSEAASASDAPAAALAMLARSAMLDGVFVNSDGTPREANAQGIMVNL